MITKTGPTFASLGLPDSLVEVVRELGYTSPTSIQAQSVPLLLSRKDVIGQSKTGSGKTAAYSLPMLTGMDVADRRVQALILCPTRELCAQVAREVRKLGSRLSGLQVLILSGGTPIYPQLSALEHGAHVVVGTPGRVIDHLSRETLDLSSVRTLVLDEADRMLEMGFEDDVRRILSETPGDRQTVLFSATFPQGIEALSRAYQKSPVRVTVADTASEKPLIRQVAYDVESADDKIDTLLWALQQNQPESAIVFCNMKAIVADVSRALRDAGVSSECLHGDLEQSDRDRVMAKFRNQSIRVLVATDVAARGIDVDNLDAVVNFDIPSRPQIYVHRVGRTGRAGKSGLAMSLVSPREQGKLDAIVETTGFQISRKTGSRLGRQALAEGRVLEGAAKMRTLFIAAGRKDKMRPGDILGALTGEAGGFKGDRIGKIEIHDRFSYVGVDAEVAQQALVRLRDGRIKGRKVRVEFVR